MAFDFKKMFIIHLKRVQMSLKNEFPRYLIMIIWSLVNIIAFIIVYFSYHNGLQYFYLRKIVQVFFF
jgi:hypothetical protein